RQHQTPVGPGDTVSIIPSIAGGTAVADALPTLSHEEILRYSRHLILPDVGVAGQRKLKSARVLLVGAGGLGSPAALYLAAAGVGTIGIVDFDVVDQTNLQRQILHGTSQVGVPKLQSAEAPPPGLVPSCAEGGVLGVLPGIIGSIQALETIKLILGAGDSLIGRLLLFDALKLSFRELKLEKDPDCPVCGPRPTVTALVDYEAFCGVGAEPSYDGLEVTAAELAAEWKRNPDLLVLDVREPHEHEIARIEGAKLIPLS